MELYTSEGKIARGKNPKNAITCAECGAPFEPGKLSTKALDEAIQLKTERADIYYERGLRCESRDNWEQGIQYFDEAIRLNSNYAEAYKQRGFFYEALNQYKRAEQDYNEAIRINPQYAEAYYFRGVFYQGQDKKAEAIADFEKTISLTDNPQLKKWARQDLNGLSK